MFSRHRSANLHSLELFQPESQLLVAEHHVAAFQPFYAEPVCHIIDAVGAQWLIRVELLVSVRAVVLIRLLQEQRVTLMGKAHQIAGFGTSHIEQFCLECPEPVVVRQVCRAACGERVNPFQVPKAVKVAVARCLYFACCQHCGSTQ